MKCFQTGTCAVAGSEIVQNLYHNHFLNLLFRPLFLNVTDCHSLPDVGASHRRGHSCWYDGLKGKGRNMKHKNHKKDELKI